MKLIKQCEYDNMSLDYWDIVIINNSWWYMLWMIKSSYHDWKTDCSWHYIKISNDSEDLDLSWSDIIYKLVWDEAWIIKALITSDKIMEDQNDKRIQVMNDINDYKEKISRIKTDLKMYENWLKESEDVLERLNNEETLFNN